MSDEHDQPPPLTDAFVVMRNDLVRAVRRHCPAWLAGDAEDLVQEALIRVMQRQRSASPPDASPAYLRRVAYSVVIDEIRKRRRRPGMGQTDVDLEDAREPAAPARDDGALGQAITRCLQRQNEDRRRALTLHLLGHSLSETGKLMASNAKRAENLVYRGLAHLRGCLRELGFGP